MILNSFIWLISSYDKSLFYILLYKLSIFLETITTKKLVIMTSKSKKILKIKYGFKSYLVYYVFIFLYQ